MSLQYFFFSFLFFIVICSDAHIESFNRKDLLLLSSSASSSSTTFKIALFADLHYGENAWTDWGPRQDINSDRVMSLVLDREKPDFVVFLGDIITANNVPIANASYYWDQAISPTRKRGLPWATIFGNHDDAHFEWPSEWFSDTGIPQVQCPLTTSLCSGCMTFSDRIPELVFWHIPSKAYKKVAPMFGVHKPCVGSINKERVAAQEAEWGIMNVLLSRHSVKAVFVGHNHGLDWCCPYKKLWLCFARHTGYGGYGNWPRGARIIEITEQPFSIRSWIRMEEGYKHSDVVLFS